MATESDVKDEDDLPFPQRATALADQLAPQERRVARYMRENLEEVAFASAAAIGARTGTSDATVIRTAKALGYSGLPELKRAAGSSLGELIRPSAILRKRLEYLDETDGGDVIDQVGNEATELLNETKRMLHASAFAAAVRLLAEAREIVTYGAGLSALVAEYLALKLNRIARPARAVTATGYDLADRLLSIEQDNAIVLCAPAQLLREHEIVVDHASRVGAPVVLITDELSGVFGNRVQVSLPAAVSPTGRVNTGLSSFLVADALLLALAAADEQRSVGGSDLLNQLRSATTGDD